MRKTEYDPIKTLIIILFLLLFLTDYSGSQGRDQHQNIVISEIGHIDTPEFARGVFVKGDIAYVTDMGAAMTVNNGLFIYNVSDPQNPTEIGHFYDGGRAHRIFVRDDGIVIIGDNIGGLEIINASDPYNPTKIGQFNGQYLNDFTIRGDLVYASDFLIGLRVIDISNLTHPTEIGRFDDLTRTQPIILHNNLVYVSDTNGMKILNVTDPSNITELAQYDYKVSDIQFVGNLAYMACSGHWTEPEGNGFKIFNITNPLNLVELGSFHDGGHPIDVEIIGDIAILSDMDEGIEVINVSNPSHPVKITQYYDGGNATNFQIIDDLIYVADGVDGLEILKIEGLPKISSSTSTISCTVTSSSSTATSETKDAPSFESFLIIIGLVLLRARRRKLRGKKDDI